MRISSYNTYAFKDKDPVIDELRTLVQDSNKSYSEIAHDAGMSQSTLHNWFHGKTRRPQSASIEAAGRAIGKMRIWADLTPAVKASFKKPVKRKTKPKAKKKAKK